MTKEDFLHGFPFITNEMSAIACQYCNKCPGTEKFSESQMMFARGYYSLYCKQCTYEIQIAHMTKCAEELPKIKALLEELKLNELKEIVSACILGSDVVSLK